MKRALLAAAALWALAGCNGTAGTESLTDPQIGSFQVAVNGVYQAGSTTPARVVTPCSIQYGGDSSVPADVRGTLACPYALNSAGTDVKVTVTALDPSGKPLTQLNRPVSFRVTPGELAFQITGFDQDGNPLEGYTNRWVLLQNGTATATVSVSKVSGEVRVWAEDEPPQVDYADGGIAGDPGTLPVEPTDRSFAVGVTEALHFQSPTIAATQIPDDGSNKTSPFVNQFVSMGLTPTGDVVTQSCDDPTDPMNGQPVKMVVTGTDSQGYYVQDITACRQAEVPVKFTLPEPSGYLPGTYGSMYVYNSSYPEGLQPGDLLQTVAGSIQEFTSTTQLNFDSWTVAEDVRAEDPSQWNKYLDLVPIVPVQLRTCGDDNTVTPYYQDVLCAFSSSNLKMESLESALVKISNVKFPDGMDNCDYNGDGTTPFFCPYQNQWTDCGSPEPTQNGQAEQQCTIDCTIGQGKWAGKLCSEESAYKLYSQYTVELAGPGPAAAGLDDSLPKRLQSVAVSGTSARTSSSYNPGIGTYAVGPDLNIWCDVPAHYRFGGTTVAANTSDPLLPANTLFNYRMASGELRVAFITDGASGTCTVAQNPHTRILLQTANALPSLNVDCSESDPDATAAQQCKNLHGARFDITGFLQQVQPARPRWMVIARSDQDVCCHPGPGLSCPTPIQQCP